MTMNEAKNVKPTTTTTTTTTTEKTTYERYLEAKAAYEAEKAQAKEEREARKAANKAKREARKALVEQATAIRDTLVSDAHCVALFGYEETVFASSTADMLRYTSVTSIGTDKETIHVKSVNTIAKGLNSTNGVTVKA